MKNKAIRKQMGVLPEYEQHIYREVSNMSDVITSDKIMREKMKKVLGAKVEKEINGVKVEVTLLDEILIGTALDAKNFPTTKKTIDLMQITGELDNKVEVNLNTPQQLFGDLVIEGSKKE